MLSNRHSIPFFIYAGLFLVAGIASIASATELEYDRDVQPLLTKYCVACHNAKEAEGGFACEDFDGLMKGSKERVVIKAGASDQSYLLKMIAGEEEPRMPPEDEAQPTDAEIAILRTWIEQGALNKGQALSLRDRLKVAAVAVKHRMEPAITAMHLVNDNKLVALGRYGEVTLNDLATFTTLERWSEVIGKVTSLRPSADGQKIVIASGVAGIGGQISVLDLASRKIVQQLEGHRDTIYSAVLSPDGSMIASAGYDRRITLWDTSTGTVIRHFDGHNGPIYDLDFHPTGTLLASCSGDETTKIWNVATGARFDTLSQGEAEQYSVRFTPDGKRVMAAGADRRVRVWQLLSREREAINPMLHSCFAHEKSIIALRLSPDGKMLVTAGEDRTVKLWTADNLLPIGELGRVDDIPSDAAWRADGQAITVATLSGRIESFEIDKLLSEFTKRRSHRPTSKPDSSDIDSNLTMTLKELATMNKKLPLEVEVEPNDAVDSAMSLRIPVEVTGKIHSDKSDYVDEDWFAFDAKVGQPWVITSSAAKPSSLLDSVIDIRDAERKSVIRTRLQAVRVSYFTFRGKDSSTSDDFRMHRWEDMELNELLYSGGEVVKLWLYPRGPDSGFKVYPGSGKRQTYFDTTANSHALGEPAWIVRELETGESPVPNGLPTFPIFFENDDDASRRFDKDSRLIFTAPKDGRYFVRLRDARQLQGEEYEYKLAIRKQMMDYKITTATKSLTVVPGTGGEFSVSVERIDDFDGPVELTIEGLPEGVIVSQPLTIEASQSTAFGTIFVPSDADDLPEKFSVTISASAQVYGQSVERRVKGAIPVTVSKTPIVLTRFAESKDEQSNEIKELVIRPGETISTFIVVERGAEMGDIAFGKEDSGRNLPHGIFVSNIGLSGLVVKPGENTREVFITAAPSVQTQTRPFHLQSTLKGKPTTKPILLHVEAR